MSDTKLVTRKMNHFTVADLLDFLKDCRPDAEIYASYCYGENSLEKVTKAINGGNYVQLVYSKTQ